MIIYGTIIIFGHFFNNFSALLLRKIYVFDFLNRVDFVQVVIKPRSIEILIVHEEIYR